MTATPVLDPPGTGHPTALACLDRVAAALGTSPEVHALHAVPPPADPRHDGEALLLAAVRGDRLGDFCHVLDTLVQSEVGAVLPGWRDRSVPDALESVHLVPQDDHLVRLRVRAVPAGTPAAEPPAGSRTLLDRAAEGGAPAEAPVDDPLPVLLAAEHRRDRDPAELLTETLVRLHIVHADARAGRSLEAYGGFILLCTALRELLRASLIAGAGPVPHAEPYAAGWAGFDATLALTPIGRRCRGELHALVAAGPPADTPALAQAAELVLRTAGHAAPAVVAGLAGPVDSYRRYLHLD
ncbi:hypothetical protein SUDANB176_06668 [Streptomyces sp. enrichment culture]|uniref:hypothetical protein n=1 Tax=Streptomyces sp. enrichment culture TaxID=1795815 RepID=UPI003F570632